MQELWLMAIPLVIMYAFFGLKQVLEAINRLRILQPLMFALTGLLIALAQFEFHTVTKTAIESSIHQAQQEMSIAYWLRAAVSSDATISADQPGRLGFYLGRAVGYANRDTLPPPDYVVARAPTVQGYGVAYVPMSLQSDGSARESSPHLAVWSRK